MVNISNLPPATPETVWALLQEVAQSQKETDRITQENAKTIKEIQKNGWRNI